ncbi:inositol polyphosphate kinase family protein [Streptomyces sp. NPDC005122]
MSAEGFKAFPDGCVAQAVDTLGPAFGELPPADRAALLARITGELNEFLKDRRPSWLAQAQQKKPVPRTDTVGDTGIGSRAVPASAARAGGDLHRVVEPGGRAADTKSVGGHGGIVKRADGRVLQKPANEVERNFYRRLRGSGDELRRIVPRSFTAGEVLALESELHPDQPVTVVDAGTGRNSSDIFIENITHSMQRSRVVDIKIGERTASRHELLRHMDASGAWLKKRRVVATDLVRGSAARGWLLVGGSGIKGSRTQIGRDSHGHLARFLSSVENLAVRLTAELQQIREVADRSGYAFVGTSLLIAVDEGAEAADRTVEAKLIDFAHVFSREDLGPQQFEKYKTRFLNGLDRLIDEIRVLDQFSPMVESPGEGREADRPDSIRMVGLDAPVAASGIDDVMAEYPVISLLNDAMSYARSDESLYQGMSGEELRTAKSISLLRRFTGNDIDGLLGARKDELRSGHAVYAGIVDNGLRELGQGDGVLGARRMEIVLAVHDLAKSTLVAGLIATAHGVTDHDVALSALVSANFEALDGHVAPDVIAWLRHKVTDDLVISRFLGGQRGLDPGFNVGRHLQGEADFGLFSRTVHDMNDVTLAEFVLDLLGSDGHLSPDGPAKFTAIPPAFNGIAVGLHKLTAASRAGISEPGLHSLWEELAYPQSDLRRLGLTRHTDQDRALTRLAFMGREHQKDIDTARSDITVLRHVFHEVLDATARTRVTQLLQDGRGIDLGFAPHVMEGMCKRIGTQHAYANLLSVIDQISRTDTVESHPHGDVLTINLDSKHDWNTLHADGLIHVTLSPPDKTGVINARFLVRPAGHAGLDTPQSGQFSVHASEVSTSGTTPPGVGHATGEVVERGPVRVRPQNEELRKRVGGRISAWHVRDFDVEQVRLKGGDREIRIVVRVAFDLQRAADGSVPTPEQAREVAKLAQEGIDEHYNLGARLPNGNRVRFLLQMVDRPQDAHHVINLHIRYDRANHRNWAVTTHKKTFGHEYGHLVGLYDGYREFIGADALPRSVYPDEALMVGYGVDKYGRAVMDNDVLHPVGAPSGGTLPARYLREFGAAVDRALGATGLRVDGGTVFSTEDSLAARADGLPARAHFPPETRRTVLYGDGRTGLTGHLPPRGMSSRPRPERMVGPRTMANGTYLVLLPPADVPVSGSLSKTQVHPVAGDLAVPAPKQPTTQVMFPDHWTEDEAVYAAEQAYLHALRDGQVVPVPGEAHTYHWVGDYDGVRIEGRLSRDEFTGFRPSADQTGLQPPANLPMPAQAARPDSGFGQRVEDIGIYGDRQTRTGVHHPPADAADRLLHHGVRVQPGPAHENGTYLATVYFLKATTRPGSLMSRLGSRWLLHAEGPDKVMFPKAWSPHEVLNAVDEAHVSAAASGRTRRVDDRTYHWFGQAKNVWIEGLVRDGWHVAYRPTDVQPYVRWPKEKPVGSAKSQYVRIGGAQGGPLQVQHVLFPNGQRGVLVTARLDLKPDPDTHPRAAEAMLKGLQKAAEAHYNAHRAECTPLIKFRLVQDKPGSRTQTVQVSDKNHSGADMKAILVRLFGTEPEPQQIKGFAVRLLGMEPNSAWRTVAEGGDDFAIREALSNGDVLSRPTTLREPNPADPGATAQPASTVGKYEEWAFATGFELTITGTLPAKWSHEDLRSAGVVFLTDVFFQGGQKSTGFPFTIVQDQTTGSTTVYGRFEDVVLDVTIRSGRITAVHATRAPVDEDPASEAPELTAASIADAFELESPARQSGATTAPTTVASVDGAALRDNEIVDYWDRWSIPDQPRSSALQRVDKAVDAWVRGSRETPDDLYGNLAQLKNILSSIEEWQDTRLSGSSRTAAVNRLLAHTEAHVTRLARVDQLLRSSHLRQFPEEGFRVRDWTGVVNQVRHIDSSSVYMTSENYDDRLDHRKDKLSPAPWRYTEGRALWVVVDTDASSRVRISDGMILQHTEFAEVVAADPELSRVNYIVLVTDRADGLDLPRAINHRTGIPVWSYTGRLHFRRDPGSGYARLSPKPDHSDNGPVGLWMVSSGNWPMPSAVGVVTGYIGDDRVSIPDGDVRTYTMVSITGWPAGRAAHTPADWGASELTFRYLPSTKSFALWRKGEYVPGWKIATPWADVVNKPYFFSAHGTPDGRAVMLPIRSGSAFQVSGTDKLEVSGNEAARMVSRRPSLNRLPFSIPIGLIVCFAGTTPSGAKKAMLLSIGQQFSNITGRTVYAVDALISSESSHRIFSVDDKAPGVPGKWLEFRPEPAGRELTKLTFISGLDKDTTRFLVRRLREEYGPSADNKPEFHVFLAGLAAQYRQNPDRFPTDPEQSWIDATGMGSSQPRYTSSNNTSVMARTQEELPDSTTSEPRSHYQEAGFAEDESARIIDEIAHPPIERTGSMAHPPLDEASDDTTLPKTEQSRPVHAPGRDSEASPVVGEDVVAGDVMSPDSHDLSAPELPGLATDGEPATQDMSLQPLGNSTLLRYEAALVRDWTGELAPETSIDFSSVYDASRDSFYVSDSSLDRLVPARWKDEPGAMLWHVVELDGEGRVLWADGEGAPRTLRSEEFAEVLAADPELAGVTRLGLVSEQPVGKRLTDAIARTTGLPVWSSTGPLDLRPDPRISGADGIGSVVLGPPEDRGDVPVGQWMKSEPSASELPLSGQTRGISAATQESVVVADEELLIHTLVDLDGRPFGNGAHTLGEWIQRERPLAFLPSTKTFSLGQVSRSVIDPKVPSPWANADPIPFFFVAHGLEDIVQLPTKNGLLVWVSGEELGRLLLRLPDLSRLPHTTPIALYSCRTGALPPGADPVTVLTIAQQVANVTGHTVHVATTVIHQDLNAVRSNAYLEDASPRVRGRWLEFRPEPAGEQLAELTRISGLDEITTRYLVRKLRDLFGAEIDGDPGFHVHLTALAQDYNRDPSLAPLAQERLASPLDRIFETVYGLSTVQPNGKSGQPVLPEDWNRIRSEARLFAVTGRLSLSVRSGLEAILDTLQDMLDFLPPRFAAPYEAAGKAVEDALLIVDEIEYVPTEPTRDVVPVVEEAIAEDELPHTAVGYSIPDQLGITADELDPVEDVSDQAADPLVRDTRQGESPAGEAVPPGVNDTEGRLRTRGADSSREPRSEASRPDVRPMPYDRPPVTMAGPEPVTTALPTANSTPRPGTLDQSATDSTDRQHYTFPPAFLDAPKSHVLPKEVEPYHEVNLQMQHEEPGSDHIDAADVAVIHRQPAGNGGLPLTLDGNDMGTADAVAPRRPLGFRERVRLARRVWEKHGPDAVRELEELLRDSSTGGPGSRTLVIVRVPGEPGSTVLWARNYEDVVRWQDNAGQEVEAPQASPDQVIESVDLNPQSQLIHAPHLLMAAGAEATSFCSLTPGMDLGPLLK